MAYFFDRLTAPESSQDRRRFRRLKAQFPIDYRFFNSQRYNQSVTCDIGEGGICFLSDGPVDLGAYIYFQANLKNRPQPLYGIARVAWSRKEPYSEKFRVGLEFIEAGSVNKADISSFIEQNKLSCYSS